MAAGLAAVVLGVVVILVVRTPQRAQEDASAVSALYEQLPYQDLFPLAEGPIEIDGQSRRIRIGFSQTGFNHPWRVEMVNSARAEVARHPNVELIVTDGKVDVVKQSGDIADLLAQGVDAIIVSPVEDAGLRAAMRRATSRSSVPVIVLDRDVEVNKSVFIGQDNASMAAAVAEVMVERLRERHGEVKGNVLVLTGLLGSKPAIGRHEGFLAVVNRHPGINVLASGDGQWIREPALRLMDDWLVRFPVIDAVFSHAEESSWGAQLAIDRAGRAAENILHLTHDGSNHGFCSVATGLFAADGNYTPYLGQVGVRAALYALMGRDMTATEPYEFGRRLRLPDLPVVTPQNVDEWRGRGWGEWNPAACAAPTK
ncbi:MAG: substrate-binding domain-containing protein [Acidobacteria bacterium]|nr:substrate-binding domain-containing protein [Acidobacteriota bacterium]